MNEMKSKQPKKMTKKQAMDAFVKSYEKTLKDNLITNMIVGFEVATEIYLEKIEKGCSIEELKEFMQKNIKNKKVIEDLVKND